MSERCRRKNWGSIHPPKLNLLALLVLKILLCLLSLPRYNSFAPVPQSKIPLLLKMERMKCPRKSSKGQISTNIFMMMDPTDISASTMIQANIDTIIPSTDDIASTSTHLVSTLLSTMYSATSGASKHSQQWSFLWFQVGPVDPYSTGHSIVPSEYGKNIQQVQDFFTPDATTTGNLFKALDPVATNLDTSSTSSLTNSADLIQIKSVMPGTPRSLVVPDPTMTQTTYNTQINKKEIETIASHFDLIMKKIPLAVTIFALVDFFGFGGKDVWNKELDDNRPQAAVDWIVQSSIRVGMAVLVVWATVFVSKWTYHPL